MSGLIENVRRRLGARRGTSSDPAPLDKTALPPIEEILEFTTDCVALLDHEWRFVFLNRNAVTALGGRDDLIGASLHDVFALERGSAEWKKTQGAARSRQAARFEFHAGHLGAWFDVHIHPSPSGLQIYFRDVTARRAADAALSKSEEILRLGLEAAGDAAWDWNLTTKTISITGRLMKALGYGGSSFEGPFEALAAIMHPDDVDLARRTLAHHLAGRSDYYRCAYRIRFRDGTWRWNLDCGRVIVRDPVTGWATRIVGTSSDISDLRFGQNKARPRPASPASAAA